MQTTVESSSSHPSGPAGMDRFFLPTSWLNVETPTRKKASWLGLKALAGMLGAIAAFLVGAWTSGAMRVIFSITSVLGACAATAALIILSRLRQQVPPDLDGRPYYEDQDFPYGM